MSLDEGIKAERAAAEMFRQFVRANASHLRLIAQWGDGYGGYLAMVVCEELGIEPIQASKPAPKKQAIPRSLAKRVFERDGYRCVTCSGHIDLCCDHVVPESQGGPTTFENLQTMCRPCNSRKGTKQ